MSDLRDSERVRKQTNSIRFNWHERLICDPVINSCGGALALAGFILHRFRSDKGYAEISFASAERELGISESTLRRARDRLAMRGWITFQRPGDRAKPKGPWAGTRFRLAGGPDDLLLDAHDAKGEGEDYAE